MEQNEAASIDVSEATDSIGQASDDVNTAMELLSQAITDELFEGLAALNGPLEEQRTSEASKATTLRQSHASLKPRVAAQLRVLASEIDRAFAEGRDSDVESKRRECAQLERNLENILPQGEACEARTRELEAEQEQNYRRIFESTYPLIRQACIAAQIAMVQMLDRVWADLQKYSVESGISGASGQPLVKIQHWLDLTPDDHGDEATYFNSLRRWFGGRQR